MTLLQPKETVRFQHGRALIVAALMAVTLALMAAPAYAAIRYVDNIDGVNGGNCLSPATACDTIADAITAASVGDEIRVRAGVYTEPEINVSKRVTMTGGYNPNGPDLWNSSNYTVTPTILDGEGTHRVLQISADNVFMHNFVVQNGNANGAAAAPHAGGGIIVIDVQGVILRGLKVINNVASDADLSAAGGGIAIVANSQVAVERSLILSNTSPALGGGIAVRPAAAQLALLTVSSSVIAHNAAAEGAAIATLGGGRSGVTLNNATIAHNDQGSANEAIFMTGGNVIGTANSFDSNGSLLVGNEVGFQANTALTVNFTSISFIMDDVTTPFTGTHEATGPSPIRELPFVNPPQGDYHLVALSPAIDINGNQPRVDLEGRKRTTSINANCTPMSLCPLGRAEDFGAYEYVHTPGTIFYVALEGSDTFNNCLVAALPCETLGNASKLVLGGDEIRLATGIHFKADANCADAAVICITQGITLTGGYTQTDWITPVNNPLLTILDGSDTRTGIRVQYDAPTGDGLIRNITVRNSNSGGNGGGIAINPNNSGPAHNLTIRNCRVEENKVISGDGGGIYASRPSNLRIENCIVANNRTEDGRGGGIAISDDIGGATYTLSSLVVHSNFASRPDENSANGGMGGGVFLQGEGTLRQSEIYSNSAAFSGGGVTTGSNNAHPTVDRVYIHDNKASMGGGFSIFVTGGANLQNSLIARNAATSTVGLVTAQTNIPMMGGNAIHSPYLGSPSEPLNVTNVTIADNTGVVTDAIRIEGQADPAFSRRNFFTNVLISGSDVGIASDGEGFAELTKVMMITNVTTKTANFDPGRLTGSLPLTGNPGFAGANDYHLLPGADGVDDGDTVAGITQDLDGVNRPVGPAFDIGAYETTLQKLNQTIDFDAISNKALAESPFPVQPTSSSGLPVNLESLTLAVCTVSTTNSGYSVTLLAEGTCTLEASQPGSATVNPAPTVTRSFEVGVVAPQEIIRLPVLVKQGEQ